jgi:predicted component of type VI protein secretion system
MLNGSMRSAAPVDPINISFVGLAKVASCTHLDKLVYLHLDRRLHVQESTNPMG